MQKATPSPFEVGDKIEDISNGSKAIVTEITPHGFKYKLEKPQYVTRPHYGTIVGGECYPMGYSLWKKIK
jgi:hypothetical protein